ncbi:MAG: hypothetical protein LDL41_08420, partial [Coleofasciculus sp. S288]|nr:hypothetical protein [Coleofasciculus sp. S288]
IDRIKRNDAPEGETRGRGESRIPRIAVSSCQIPRLNATSYQIKSVSEVRDSWLVVSQEKPLPINY